MGNAGQGAKDGRVVEDARGQRLGARSKGTRSGQKTDAKPPSVSAAYKLAEFDVDALSLRHWRIRRFGPPVVMVPWMFVAMLLLRRAPTVTSISMPLPIVFFICSLLQLFIPGRVSIGEDGVLVRWGWQRRFVAIADIASIEVDHEASAFNVRQRVRLLIHCKSGKTDDILVAGRPRGVFGASEFWRKRKREAVKMKKCIESAMAAASGAAAGQDAPALPPRGSKSSEDWIVELRDVLHHEGYRTQAAPMLADLWRVVGDTTADPAKRAAAAVVLGPMLDDQGRKRLRIVADATAAPELHDALDAIARRHDELLAVALDELALASRAAKGG
jgi:hypothetical protein